MRDAESESMFAGRCHEDVLKRPLHNINQAHRRQRSRLARRLRRDATQAERILWNQVRDRQLCGIKFRRQHPLAGYVADFYVAERHLVVELDGAIHDTLREDDARRSQIFAAHGVYLQ